MKLSATGGKIWFVTGSQGLYGEDVLRQVADQSREIASRLDGADSVAYGVVWKPVLTDAASIRRLCLDANGDDDCLGLVVWMHTFSPAKMWISGLDALRRPLLHLHTQANVALPWAEIDMDFMNLNQAAHGDREFGYIQTRLGIPRKTVAGHVSDPRVTDRIGVWARAAAATAAARRMRLARFGDNMRDVAVTEGDKVEAELRFGVSVNTYGVNDLVEAVDAADGSDVDKLVAEYEADVRRRAPAARRRGPTRVAALRRPHRARPAPLPHRGRVHRVHHELPGPGRAAPTARPRRAAADGRRLRVRRRG